MEVNKQAALKDRPCRLVAVVLGPGPSYVLRGRLRPAVRPCGSPDVGGRCPARGGPTRPRGGAAVAGSHAAGSQWAVNKGAGGGGGGCRGTGGGWKEGACTRVGVLTVDRRTSNH